MKNGIKMLLLGIAVIGVMILCGYMEQTYTRDCKVNEIENNMITFEDSQGNLWEYESTENYTIGENKTLVMNNNNTHTHYDDIIIRIR